MFQKEPTCGGEESGWEGVCKHLCLQLVCGNRCPAMQCSVRFWEGITSRSEKKFNSTIQL